MASFIYFMAAWLAVTAASLGSVSATPRLFGLFPGAGQGQTLGSRFGNRELAMETGSADVGATARRLLGAYGDDTSRRLLGTYGDDMSSRRRLQGHADAGLAGLDRALLGDYGDMADGSRRRLREVDVENALGGDDDNSGMRNLLTSSGGYGDDMEPTRKLMGAYGDD